MIEKQKSNICNYSCKTSRSGSNSSTQENSKLLQLKPDLKGQLLVISINQKNLKLILKFKINSLVLAFEESIEYFII